MSSYPIAYNALPLRPLLTEFKGSVVSIWFSFISMELYYSVNYPEDPGDGKDLDKDELAKYVAKLQPNPTDGGLRTNSSSRRSRRQIKQRPNTFQVYDEMTRAELEKECRGNDIPPSSDTDVMIRCLLDPQLASERRKTKQKKKKTTKTRRKN